MPVSVSELLLDLVLAAAMGAAIGIQRQAAQKPAGFRTHLLVALASCAFAEIGRLAGDDRITANVLTGIGFLGAGAIFRSGCTAHGLTTAASIWTVAAVGVAIGFGHPYSVTIGVTVTVLTVLALSVSDAVFSRIFLRKATLGVIYAGDISRNICTEVLTRHKVWYETTGESRITNAEDGHVVEVHYHIALPRGTRLSSVLHDLAGLPGVRSVTTEAPLVNVL